MDLTRTTLRLRSDLKYEAEKLALVQNVSLQEVFNTALESYLRDKSKLKAKKLVIPSVSLGVSLDNLTRDDIYGTPNL